MMRAKVVTKETMKIKKVKKEVKKKMTKIKVVN